MVLRRSEKSNGKFLIKLILNFNLYSQLKMLLVTTNKSNNDNMNTEYNCMVAASTENAERVVKIDIS